MHLESTASDGAPTDRTTTLLGLTPSEFTRAVGELGEPRYRAEQVLQWVYGRGVAAFDQMSNLPRRFRDTLAQKLTIYQSQIVCRRDSTDGTIKLLLQWPDGASSECVLIPEARRRTACVSTQVGCPAGCVFCASGIGGLQRNLTAAEIIEQTMRIRDLCASGTRLSNVVFMGLGEPLANYGATVGAIRAINAPWGMDIGARKITVSTVGLPSKMNALADEQLQITLALSLHAPNDTLRREIIPWAQRVDLDELVAACDYYFKRTGREVTLEYILLAGVNDTAHHAEELAELSKRMRSNINLIRYNPVEGLPFARPDSDQAQLFLGVLRERGVSAHLRKSRGLDVTAACGQLRRQQDA
ncbi:MAG: 23S rRNA (adenine(2503)-C(2))-methyltransferase RlmN [Phycisphaerae bacterium]